MDPFKQAIDILVERGSLPPELLPALSALDASQCEAFAAALRAIPEPRRLELLRALRSEAETNLQLDANPALRAATDDPSPSVRRLAIELIEEDRTPELLARLLRLLREDPDAEVRGAAAAALGEFAYLAEVGELTEREAEQVESELLACVHRPGEVASVRGLALASAGYFSDERVASEIRSAYGQPELRTAAIRAMGRTADPSWTPQLINDLSSAEPEVRAEAARALGESEDPRGARPLSDLVDDPVLGVRLAAIEALGHIGGERAREALLYCLGAEDDEVRDAAEQALEELEFFEEPLQP